MKYINNLFFSTFYFRAIVFSFFLSFCLLFGSARNVYADWPGECHFVLFTYYDTTEPVLSWPIYRTFDESTGLFGYYSNENRFVHSYIHGALASFYWEDDKWNVKDSTETYCSKIKFRYKVSMPKDCKSIIPDLDKSKGPPPPC